ncbi:Cytoskeletal protein Sojo [Entamoeba marina]
MKELIIILLTILIISVIASVPMNASSIYQQDIDDTNLVYRRKLVSLEKEIDHSNRILSFQQRALKKWNGKLNDATAQKSTYETSYKTLLSRRDSLKSKMQHHNKKNPKGFGLYRLKVQDIKDYLTYLSTRSVAVTKKYTRILEGLSKKLTSYNQLYTTYTKEVTDVSEMNTAINQLTEQLLNSSLSQDARLNTFSLLKQIKELLPMKQHNITVLKENLLDYVMPTVTQVQKIKAKGKKQLQTIEHKLYRKQRELKIVKKTLKALHKQLKTEKKSKIPDVESIEELSKTIQNKQKKVSILHKSLTNLKRSKRITMQQIDNALNTLQEKALSKYKKSLQTTLSRNKHQSAELTRDILHLRTSLESITNETISKQTKQELESKIASYRSSQEEIIITKKLLSRLDRQQQRTLRNMKDALFRQKSYLLSKQLSLKSLAEKRAVSTKQSMSVAERKYALKSYAKVQRKLRKVTQELMEIKESIRRLRDSQITTLEETLSYLSKNGNKIEENNQVLSYQLKGIREAIEKKTKIIEGEIGVSKSKGKQIEKRIEKKEETEKKLKSVEEEIQTTEKEITKLNTSENEFDQMKLKTAQAKLQSLQKQRLKFTN